MVMMIANQQAHTNPATAQIEQTRMAEWLW
jgi:hypothetical protein